MECFFCNRCDSTVVEVASCASRCDPVCAHPRCFRRRHTFAVWRRKHSHRDNHETEVCVRLGCVAKMTPLRTSVPLPPKTSECVILDAVPDHELRDPSRPCAFLGRDGRPCRHPALDNGACRIHKRDADLLLQMTREKEDEELACPPLPQTIDDVVVEEEEVPPVDTRRDASTQVNLRCNQDLVKELRDTVSALRKENASLVATNASRDADLLLMRTEVLRVIDRLVE